MFSPKLIVSTFNNDTKANSVRVESPASYFCSTNHYEQQLNIENIRKYSLSDAIRLASQANMKHDANGCCDCNVVAGYYITAVRYARESAPVICNRDMFDLVWRMTNLVLSHRETSKYQYLSWYEMITLELWEFAKQLKDESYECDQHIPTYGANIKRGSIDSVTSDTSYNEDANDEENYRRAIRITIYNCRALVYEQSSELNQAIIYYRKCASVRPTPFEPQQFLQKSALDSMQRLIRSFPQSPISRQRPSYSGFMSSDSLSTSTTTSSSSSVVSRSPMNCSHCGIEKITMPVCAKCKVQPYCSIRCMKSHKDTHSSVCGSTSKSRSF
ncbi:uncharacterized protein EV154DRAFT_521637 [Mucor mucedo]|uniref:uncharacterized protein n=1 Tax=Mucor mucedo TaxID=29922 RepID=UPI0022206DD3|nr:uncharacterized protein EV154DRAFT_521637 [Mucor mucedo]KAI7885960.1 hypothetical protein EV154DRAFT_521637 [Mucor mucedo]